MRLITEYFLSGVVWLILGVILVLDLNNNVAVFLRFFLGLIVVVYIPGYFLQTAIFSTNHLLSSLERTVLSVGLSLGVIPVLALILDKFSLGFRLPVVAVSLGLVTFILALSSWLLRIRVPRENRYLFLPEPRAVRLAIPTVRVGSIPLIALALLGGVGVGLGVSNAVLPKPAALVTEFFILDSEGGTSDYLKEVVVGTNVSVSSVIVNHEGDTQTYRIDVVANDQILATSEPISLANNEQVEQAVSFQLDTIGERQMIEFNLYRTDETIPYRTVHLWVNVTNE
jgi:uncharacterized membrane protein